MEYKACPQCGKPKHPLLSCPNCGHNQRQKEISQLRVKRVVINTQPEQRPSQLTRKQRRRLDKNRPSVIQGVMALHQPTGSGSQPTVATPGPSTQARPTPSAVPQSPPPTSNPFTTCPECHGRVKHNNLKKHLAKVHGIIVPGYSFSTSRPILILSKTPSGGNQRGTRIDSPIECAECHKIKRPVWRYNQSTLGIVCICSECWGIVRDRSYGPIDALTSALPGGLFDGNRRKH